MKGRTILLHYYLDHPDSVVQSLGEVLDDAVTNRTDQLVFLTCEEDTSADPSSHESSTSRSTIVIRNAARYVEILAEFERRVRSASGKSADDASTSELFGTGSRS